DAPPGTRRPRGTRLLRDAPARVRTNFLSPAWGEGALCVEVTWRARSSSSSACGGSGAAPRSPGQDLGHRGRAEHVLIAEGEDRLVPGQGVGGREHPVVLAG